MYPKITLLAGVLSLMAGQALAAETATEYQAVVSKTAQPKSFTTINDALNAAPPGETPYAIYIKKGTYVERLIINRKNVSLIGEDRQGTIIEANTAAGHLNPQGQKWGTSGSSTVLVDAPDVTVKNLTIRNSFDFPANNAKAKDDPERLKDTQAVAVLLGQKADRARFDKVTLEGYQDTLYSKTGSRSYFTDCLVSGHVDFIFGSGVTVFDRCEIRARNRTDTQTPYGYITAPSTSKEQPYGLVFLNSRLTKEAGVPAGSFGLGRPWHPTVQLDDGRYADPNAIGQTVYVNTTMDDHIYGWDKMSGKDKDGSTIWFLPQDSRFFEYASKGPGAKVSDDRRQLTAQDAAKFTVSSIFPDWNVK